MKEDYQAVLDYAGHGKKVVGFPRRPRSGAWYWTDSQPLALLQVGLRDGLRGLLRLHEKAEGLGARVLEQETCRELPGGTWRIGRGSRTPPASRTACLETGAIELLKRFF